jgi:hypothetical protein
MPSIPKEPHRPDKKEVVIDLLESIALEEIALAHILNAEAEKIQAFVGDKLDFPTCPSNEEILLFNKSAGRVLETVVMKEWLLLNKLQDVLEFACRLKCFKKHHDPHKHCDCHGECKCKCKSKHKRCVHCGKIECHCKPHHNKHEDCICEE